MLSSIYRIAGGNFGEIYTFPAGRVERNLFNDGTTGMLESADLGNAVNPVTAGFTTSGTIDTIKARGMLNCGISGDRPGFANFNTEQGVWEGMDVDLCIALASSLFDGDINRVVFLPVEEDTDAGSGFTLLNSGEVDVLAGALWTLENDVREPTTNSGFSFSRPYFYGPVNDTRYAF